MQGKSMDCKLFALPTLHPSNNQHASSNCGPAAPSTPAPPNNDLLAALIIASTTNVVMSLPNKQHHQHLDMNPDLAPFQRHKTPYKFGKSALFIDNFCTNNYICTKP